MATHHDYSTSHPIYIDSHSDPTSLKVPRCYQTELLQAALRDNIIVVLGIMKELYYYCTGVVALLTYRCHLIYCVM